LVQLLPGFFGRRRPVLNSVRSVNGEGPPPTASGVGFRRGIVGFVVAVDDVSVADFDVAVVVVGDGFVVELDLLSTL
jgi:hypothetical protein